MVVRDQGAPKELQLGFYSYKYDIEEASKVPEGFDPEGDEDSLPLVLPMVESARDWLVKHAENLLSQQNRLEFVKKAHFDMNARSIVPYWALRGFYIPEELADDLLGPVKRSFIKTLPAFANLQTLELTHFELDQTAVRTLCMLSTLQVLSLVYSRFEQATAAYLREEEHDLTMNVPSLRLRPRIGEWIMVSLWHTLCFCPSVRNLTIRHSSSKDLQRTMTFPPPEIWSKFKCSLFTIERLFLDGLGSRRIDEIFNWIHTARSAPDGQPSRPLTLTHFKFAPSATWSDADVLSVLQALQSPLMKVLSLEALPFELGRTNTVRQIAQCFPNLQALTLAIRANRRQWMMKVVTWKDPVWSFAQTLTGFSCLEHFEWNNDIPPHTSTPSPFVEMEEHEVEGTFKEDGSSFYCWDALYFDDYHLNAAPFAAYCPTLKTWVANKGAVLTSDQILCEIRRRPQSKSLNHGEEVKIVCVPKRDRPDLGRYDPGTYNSEYSTWPNVDP
ncbi:hypothetical protein BKA70DRAFT_1467168 [Coprinopsis sp. MPI-PUGE-AT-0042]|nr:hypothetical protein BKA70DRAFT_1467168 [Coprinopsis sp. MPI-PUGE-AT-0042]